ncbi:hypothetical protein [Shinella sp.]|nr:hypothetical protein [Shinella sp.]MDX3972582.1 hypothetical protein [Shinella sp.]
MSTNSRALRTVEARESFAKYLFETFPAVTFDRVRHRFGVG